MRTGPQLLMVMLVLSLATSVHAQEVLQHWQESGTASTPTAPDALKIDATVKIVRQRNKQQILIVDVTTANGALTDNGVGCVRVELRNNNAPVSSFATCSARNKGRGLPWNEDTVRYGHRVHHIPNGLSYNRVAFKFYNADHRGESVNWANVIQLGAMIVTGL